MLITKEIEVKITRQNINHYRKIGKNVNLKDNIMVKPEELPKNSHKILKVVCDVCGKELDMKCQTYNKRLSCLNYITCKKCSIEKIKKLNLIKYGVDNFLITDEFKNKSNKTKIEKYNDINYNNPEENKKTCLSKYGKEYPLQVEEFKEKLKKTNFIKYGKEYYYNIEKLKKTCLERYGDTSAMKNENIKKKAINIKMKKRIPLLSKYGIVNINENNEYVCNKNHVFNMNKGTISSRLNYKTILCPICNPLYSSNSSGYQIQLSNFIKENYNDEILINNKNIIDKEIDIYLPKLKLGFEFNGLFWHNEIGKEKNYHLNKTNLAEQKGIKLIQIYEDDWLYKQNIIKSRILNLLNKTPNKIYARKCTIEEIENNKLIRDFLQNNHLQGYIGSKIKIGLFYNNELISLMTFGNFRKAMGQKSLEHSYEMLRFCNKLNTNIIGGASRLFKYFVKKYKPIEVISYADRSWSSGDLYKKLEFILVNKTQPNYYYIIDGIRKHRFGFRKDILVKNGADPNKTEHEIMLDRKIYRIYDSGNLKFIFKQ